VAGFRVEGSIDDDFVLVRSTAIGLRDPSVGRGEVIRVRRVAEPEQDRDGEHDHERPSVGTRCN